MTPRAARPAAEPPAPKLPAAPQVREREQVAAPALDESPADPGPPPTTSDAAFRRGVALVQRKQFAEAEAAYRAALGFDPAHDLARRALAGLLASRGDTTAAEQVLANGLRGHPEQSRVALDLARLQMGREAWTDAQRTLDSGLPYAQGNATYLATTAALKSRVGQQREAARLYESALRIAPDNAAWLIGLGQTLQAEGRRQEAVDAYLRARDLDTLDAQQRALVERKLRELGG